MNWQCVFSVCASWDDQGILFISKVARQCRSRYGTSSERSPASFEEWVALTEFDDDTSTEGTLLSLTHWRMWDPRLGLILDANECQGPTDGSKSYIGFPQVGVGMMRGKMYGLRRLGNWKCQNFEIEIYEKLISKSSWNKNTWKKW